MGGVISKVKVNWVTDQWSPVPDLLLGSEADWSVDVPSHGQTKHHIARTSWGPQLDLFEASNID